MPIELYPNIAKVKRNGVYQNLPGFVQASSDSDIKAMIATSETSTTAQFVHKAGSYFILNDVLYQADENIAVNDIIAVGTNCHVEILGNDVEENAKNISDLKDTVDEMAEEFEINYTLNDGYIASNGAVISPTQYNEKYTNKIGCIPGQVFSYTVTLSSANGMWAGYALYDKNNRFISQQASARGWIKTFTETFTIPENAYAFVIMFRTFSGATMNVNCTNWGYLLTNVTLPPQTIIRDFHLNNSAYYVSVRGINHTGYYTAPENTIPAFKLSKANGFSFVETDLHITSDNVPVLLHDETINRTARNADGTEISTPISIQSITYQQALTYDFGIYKGSEYAGTKIPSLEEFIILCRNLDLHAYIEIKGNWSSTKLAIAYNIVKKYAMESKVTWTSSSATYLAYAKGLDAYARLGYVVETISSTKIEECQALLTEHNNIFILGNYNNFTSEIIASVAAASLQLEAYTINTEEDMLDLDAYVCGVVSNTYDYSQVLLSEAT